MTEKNITDAGARMDQALKHLQHQLDTTRTGRASPALVEDLEVNYYGQPTPLKHLAGISIPEARVLVIQPWDRNAIAEIERAILKSDIGITPNNDGTVIHLPIPALSEDRRKDLVKQVHKLCEEARVAVRNVRRDAHEHLRVQAKTHEISEDDLRRAEQKLQVVTDQHVKAIDTTSAAKEREVMTV